MRFLHPLFMMGFLCFFVIQRKLGLQMLGLKERSPSFSDRQILLEKHRFYGFVMVIFGFVGMVGGILSSLFFLNAQSPFLQTYGHGFLGSIGWGILLSLGIIGLAIKRVVKPKIRERFLLFHQGMFYLSAVFGILSLITGIVILQFGLQTLP